MFSETARLEERVKAVETKVMWSETDPKRKYKVVENSRAKTKKGRWALKGEK